MNGKSVLETMPGAAGGRERIRRRIQLMHV